MCQRLLYNLVHLKIICSSQADQALSEFSSFYHTSLRERKTSFESFQKERDRLNDFYVKETDISNYKNLSSVFKLVLVLSHGQAAVEWGFSVYNKALNFNMGEISIISRKLIIDQMNSHSLLPQSFPITKNLLKSVRCSRQRYQEFLREKESSWKQNAQCAQLAIITKCTVCSVSHHNKMHSVLS